MHGNLAATQKQSVVERFPLLWEFVIRSSSVYLLYLMHGG